MRRLLSIWAMVVATVAAVSADDNSVRAVIDLVRSGISKHTPDKAVAKSLHKLTLNEKLDLRTIEELESEGAGRETIAALEALLETSAGKPASTGIPPFNVPARPSIEEQKSLFHQIDVNALRYTRSLPDFICTEVVRRYQMAAPRRPGPSRGRPDVEAVGAGYWIAKDVLTVKLSYFENREKYELTLVNGHKTRETYESSGGAISEGDFGSVLLEIFSRDSGTKFQWDHWTHLRTRLTRVYSYRTARERSHYKIGVGQWPGDRRMVVGGRHGFIYADDATGMVMRITGEADEIPLGFPVLAQSSILDYDFADVGGQQFLLPLRVLNNMKTAQVTFKNVLEFKDYRKFIGESTISFGSPDDGPPQQPQM